jgi:hypothetical protein
LGIGGMPREREEREMNTNVWSVIVGQVRLAKSGEWDGLTGQRPEWVVVPDGLEYVFPDAGTWWRKRKSR